LSYILIEDFCRAIDTALEPLTLNRTMFLIFIAIVFFLLTLLGLILTERRTHGSANTKITIATSIIVKVAAILCIIVSITSFFLYIFKSTSVLRLPIEYFAGWLFYGLFLLLMVIGSLKYTLKVGSETKDTYKIMNVLIITIWFSMILGLAGDSLGSSYVASEDAMDVMILSLEGHLFKSMHAPHYDLAPMHTFLYITISQVLGLRLVPEQNTFAWELITISLLTSLFLAFKNFIDLIEIHNNERKKLLKLLVPILLTIHPYALGILSASHVNGLSGVLAFLIILVIFKDIIRGGASTLSKYLLILLMMVTSILTHPLGFVILFLALISLAILLKKNYMSVERLVAITVISASLLFVLKGLYTGAFQSLQTFVSYMLEAFFSGFQRLSVFNVEITPRTYEKVPVSANTGYVASLGVLAGITFYILLRYRCLIKSRHNCNAFLLYILLNNAIVLALALISFFVVMTGTPTKYVVGTYISMMSLIILIYFSDLLKKCEVRGIGFLVLVLVLVLSSLSSLVSPLKTPTNYRVFQGSLPAIDQDVDFAIKLSNLVEPMLGERYIVIQYATPLKGPIERSIGEALEVYVSHAKFKVLYGYDTGVLDLNIVLNHWVFMLVYG
jgi:hypothetical protein